MFEHEISFVLIVLLLIRFKEVTYFFDFDIVMIVSNILFNLYTCICQKTTATPKLNCHCIKKFETYWPKYTILGSNKCMSVFVSAQYFFHHCFPSFESQQWFCCDNFSFSMFAVCLCFIRSDRSLLSTSLFTSL